MFVEFYDETDPARAEMPWRGGCRSLELEPGKPNAFFVGKIRRAIADPLGFDPDRHVERLTVDNDDALLRRRTPPGIIGANLGTLDPPQSGDRLTTKPDNDRMIVGSHCPSPILLTGFTVLISYIL